MFKGQDRAFIGCIGYNSYGAIMGLL